MNPPPPRSNTFFLTKDVVIPGPWRDKSSAHLMKIAPPPGQSWGLARYCSTRIPVLSIPDANACHDANLAFSSAAPFSLIILTSSHGHCARAKAWHPLSRWHCIRS